MGPGVFICHLGINITINPQVIHLKFLSEMILTGKQKKRHSAPGPLGDFFIVSFKNSVPFYFVKKIRKLPSILYDNCL